MAIAAFPPGHVIGDRFRIVRKLGEGGMAVVYEAIDQKLGERRALKFAKAGYSRMIPPETRSALRVTHDNICRTYEIHTTGAGVPVDFISMEFIEGETLQARCQREILRMLSSLISRNNYAGDWMPPITRKSCIGISKATT